MIDKVSRGETWAARHGGSSNGSPVVLSRKDSRPLFHQLGCLALSVGPLAITVLAQRR
jgi:hypothetical protein